VIFDSDNDGAAKTSQPPADYILEFLLAVGWSPPEFLLSLVWFLCRLLLSRWIRSGALLPLRFQWQSFEASVNQKTQLNEAI
jgi:hypothetical protein